MRFAGLAVLSVMLLGCTDDGDDGAGQPELTAGQVSADADRWFTCTDESLRFRLGAFSAPANEEDAQSPIGEAIRAEIRRHNAQAHPEDIPLDGWRLLAKENGQLLFGAGPPEHFAFIVLRPDAPDNMLRADSGPACLSYSVSSARLLSARWVLQGNATSATTTFVALVNERGCTGGADPTKRLVGPDVDYRDDAVVVTFFVEPLPPPEPDPRGIPTGYGCVGPPPTPVTVTLSVPLGDRELLDGGSYPAKEPVVPTDV